MTQLTYNLYMGAKHIGMISDARPHLIETRAAEGIILFGYAIVEGTDPLTQVKIPAATGKAFRGISISTWAKEQDALGDGKYTDKEAVNILRRGEIWVMVNGNVTVDDAAYFVYTGADAGKFRNDATNADAVPTGVFKNSANSGELALIEINLP